MDVINAQTSIQTRTQPLRLNDGGDSGAFVPSPNIDVKVAVSILGASEGNIHLAAERIRTRYSLTTTQFDIHDLTALLTTDEGIKLLRGQIQLFSVLATLEVARSAKESFLDNINSMEPGEVARTFLGAIGRLNELSVPARVEPSAGTSVNINNINAALSMLPPDVRDAIMEMASESPANSINAEFSSVGHSDEMDSSDD